MKFSYTTLFIALILMFTGCAGGGDDPGEVWGTGIISLSVTNRSSYDLTAVRYDNTDFGSIASGRSAFGAVAADVSYIYFSIGEMAFRTNDVVAVSENEQNSFTFTDNTLIFNIQTQKNIKLSQWSFLPPQNVAASLSGLDVTVNWDAVGIADGYEVYWHTVNNAAMIPSGNKAAVYGGTTTSHTITGLSNNTRYYIWVKAKKGSDISDFSNAAQAMVIIPIPQNVAAIPSSGQITVSWDAVGVADGYEVYWHTVNNAAMIPSGNKAAVYGGTTTSHTITGLTDDTTYYVWVKTKIGAELSDFGASESVTAGYKVGGIGPGGGYIFYDKGGVSGGWRYKEAASEDLPGRYKWSNGRGAAAGYRGGGFSGWYLPSKEELVAIYSELHDKGLGGFAGSNYWSSTEYHSYNAYYVGFHDGLVRETTKSSTARVRPVRAF